MHKLQNISVKSFVPRTCLQVTCHIYHVHDHPIAYLNVSLFNRWGYLNAFPSIFVENYKRYFTNTLSSIAAIDRFEMCVARFGFCSVKVCICVC